jgi:hypothetical protein
MSDSSLIIREITDNTPNIIKNSSKSNLDIGFCNLRHADFKLLYNEIINNKCIKSLDLRYNYICKDLEGEQISQGSLYLQEIIEQNTNIIELNLKSNCIDNLDMKYICKVLAYNTNIRYINLDSNLFCIVGIDYLCDSLKINRTIESIDIKHMSLKYECYEMILRILQNNTIITNIELNDTRKIFSYLFEVYGQEKCNKAMNKIQKLLERNRKIKKAIIDIMIFIIGIRKYSKKDEYGLGYWIWLPLDVVKMIAQEIWRSRADLEWLDLKNL